MDLIYPLSLIAYGLAAGLQGFQLKKSAPALKVLTLTLVLIGLLSHGYLLHHFIDTPQGQNLSAINVFSFVTWMMVLLLFISALTQPSQKLFLFILPLAVVGLALEPLTQTQSHVFRTGENPWMLSHILLSLMAFGQLSIAALQGILLSIQDRAIRKGRFMGFFQFFPALDIMESLLFRFIALGFLLLSLVLLSGFWIFPHPFTLVMWQKTVFGLLAWGVFAILLLGRVLLGWRGATAIRLTEVGMVLLILAYVGARFLLVFLL